MKAIILAAGQGNRLKKYTHNLPKGMLEFAGKTIIKRQIDLFRVCGIQDITIVRGYEYQKIYYSGVKYYNNDKYASTNMVESLMVAKKEFNDDIIISYSDIIFNKNMLQQMINSTGDYNVAVDDNWKKYWIARYGKINYDTESLCIGENNTIQSLGKENPPMEEIDSRYIGLLKFSKRGITSISDILNRDYKIFGNEPWKQSGMPIRKAYMTDLLNAIIENKDTVCAVRFNSGWIEFDTDQDYERANSWLVSGLINDFVEI